MYTVKTKLGKFAQDTNGALYGRVSALGIGSTSILSQEAVTRDEKPYLRLVADEGNASYEVGVAFPKLKDGIIYYSVSLDSPLFPTPISAVLYPDRENEGMYDLIWIRQEAPKPSVEANAKQAQTRRFVGSSTAPSV